MVQARLDVRQVKPPGLSVYLRSRVESRRGEAWVVPLPTQLSGDLSSSADVGALALLPAGRTRLGRGARVAAILLGPMAGA